MIKPHDLVPIRERLDLSAPRATARHEAHDQEEGRSLSAAPIMESAALKLTDMGDLHRDLLNTRL
jgi:hypothetical protein